MPDPSITLAVNGREVTITNPKKVYFPKAGYTKLDVVNYFLAVAEGAVRGVRDRPMILKRFPNGADQPPFFQKRAPSNLPPWMRTSHITFPSGRTADEVVVDDPAGLAWVANLGCLDLNPWPVRTPDVDHPDELRVDLDPTPQSTFADVRAVALEVRKLLDELGYRGYPKTSGSRGIHILVRLEPHWTFQEVRRAALALGREIERRNPALATTAWWKEERHAPVFIDYNQNARDRTVASAYSIRPLPDARVSCPLEWDEVADVDPAAFTLATVPARFAAIGDPHTSIDDHAHSLQPLLDLVARHEREGQGDAPWPPNYPKAEGEPPRVQPSKRKK
jgi:DNA ligase D